MSFLKIVSWNVNGLRSIVTKDFLGFLRENSPDVVCLQETKTNEPLEFDGYRSFWSFAEKKGYSGTAILTKEEPIEVRKSSGFREIDGEGRFVSVEFEGFTVFNVYLPHGSRDKSKMGHKMACYRAFRDLLAKNQKPAIVCGDFNVAHTELDLARPKDNTKNTMFTPRERAEFQKILDLGFVDTFRMLHKDGGHYTWWPWRNKLRQRNVGWRLDYVLASQKLAPGVREAFILAGVEGSDHCPVGIELETT